MKGNYFLYVTTNPSKTILYANITNNLSHSIQEHYANKGKLNTFAESYYCYCLLYYQRFDTVVEAIEAETELKGWVEKEKLIEEVNPEWKFLNTEI